MKFYKATNKDINETIYYGEHESGLGVFIIPKQGFTKKYAILGAKIGSVDNNFIPNNEATAIKVPDGIAHFLEHKMFEQPDGTNAFDKFAEYGANANAFTSFTSTCYLFSATDNFYESFEHLLSYVRSPHFTDENVAKEQGIIGQEIRMYEDDGNWRVMFNLLSAMYKRNPIRTDIAGTIESISQITKDTLYKCYNTFYNPSNMVVCVCGDVEKEEVEKVINKVIPLEKTGYQANSLYPDEPTDVGRNYVEQNLSVSMPLFNLGFKDDSGKFGFSLLKDELITNIILRSVAGKSSNLYESLYKEGLINEEFSYDYLYEPQFSCAIIGGESKDPKLVQEKTIEYLNNKEGIDQEEFERAKKSIYGGYLRTFNDVSAIADLVCRSTLKGIDIFKFSDILNEITLDDVNHKYHYLFKDAKTRTSLSVIYPKEGE